MGILDYLKCKNNSKTVTEDQQNTSSSIYTLILEKEIANFFPVDKTWHSNCFRRERDVCYRNLPCHLRDNNWLSKLFQDVLAEKGIIIPRYTIKKFMDTSPVFEKYRHDHELETVKWQIDYMRNNGEGWLMPKGFDEFSLLFSNQVDTMFRGGVLKTLSAIGMDPEVIEEGIEKHADMWRDRYMKRSFSNEFEPIFYLEGAPEPADDEFKANWLRLRNYDYYQEHKRVVDLYGQKSDGMEMSKEEAVLLRMEVMNQENARKKVINEWKKNRDSHTYKPSMCIYE